MTFWILLLIIFLLFLILKKREDQPTLTEESSSILEEEQVLEIQRKFERRRKELKYAPDTPSEKEMYIYENLMRGWFYTLSGKHRYDNEMIQKIRKDWVNYMSLLEEASTDNYLALESDDEETEMDYRDDHIKAVLQLNAIEDAFAHLMGEKEFQQLENTRKQPYSFFLKDGSDKDLITKME
ncbi:TPA: hypothetical protein DEP34_03210 [Candidatus Uhrbacteria bacterium]|uniref:Uncharacterized protein n=2 Tax=Candidatus Uhriibacteriota TaxID=1752732 RepID=A0A0G1SGX1_9BACT|nr:MAG: hypothetical protein UX45_C0001G0083 [Candidatus Uhrbacteria bacterium GW2011_GWF2_46_218]KKU41353.1 MAG: hypothetical protein UX57_C0004G0057 [Candidatus Uhrbacteria bacterium GW2011_GWE2_46_68]HBK33787.1 hypothetical protein [Candidatus Uhrbacteria bacterium]HCB19372.1 hypothetical protein [Candidatus Uhrbacteria bacterium]